MTFIESFAKELEREAITTRKMLQLVPDDKYSWKPHEKSMELKRLAAHVAELPGWIGMALTTSELDFANNNYAPEAINNNKELMAYFEKNLADARMHLSKAHDDQLTLPWTLRNGNEIYSTEPKADVIRMSLSQIIHHRAQLGVYLRLLNIPIPGSYGPSADEMKF
ncbi:MAG TPA: DinB family protein [Chitinophagaceae bacterium]